MIRSLVLFRSPLLFLFVAGASVAGAGGASAPLAATFASPSAASPALARFERALLEAAPALAREAAACLRDLAVDALTVRAQDVYVQDDSMLQMAREWRARPRWVKAWAEGWFNSPLVIKEEPISQLPQTRETMALLRRFRGLVVAGYSMLQPGSRIARHADDAATGMRNKMVTVHLGLVVPADGECNVTVWDAASSAAGRPTRLVTREGELLTFDSTNDHEAANGGSTPRVVLYLLLDIARFEADLGVREEASVDVGGDSSGAS